MRSRMFQEAMKKATTQPEAFDRHDLETIAKEDPRTAGVVMDLVIMGRRINAEKAADSRQRNSPVVRIRK